jgi:2-keto-4-pentenoate hydratase
MPAQPDIDSIAAQLLADYDAGTPQALFAAGLRLDLTNAWQVQTALTHLREARGERVIGYKVGAITPVNQQMMGLPHPVWGRLWDTEMHAHRTELHKHSYANIAIEAEFGIRLGEGIAPGSDINTIAASVTALHPTLELHNLVFGGDKPHGAELIANNCINCGVVCGKPVNDLPTACSTDLKLVFDGAVVDEWDTLTWPDDILAAVRWLTGSLADHGIALKAGDFILTSAWGPPIAVGDASTVEVTTSAFGGVSATFAG